MHALALQASPLMTLEEWAELSEDTRGELVDGVLVEEEMASVVHEIVQSFLIGELRPWARQRRGLVLGPNVDLVVSPTRGRHPDVCVFIRQLPPGHGLVRIPPDLVVEVVSPTPRDARRDRVEKFQEYAAFGVRSYWIVNPALRILEVFELGQDGRYVAALTATGGRVAPAAGLEIDLDALWAEVELVEPA